MIGNPLIELNTPPQGGACTWVTPSLLIRRWKESLPKGLVKMSAISVTGSNMTRSDQFGLDFLCIELLHWSKYVDVVTMKLDKKINSCQIPLLQLIENPLIKLIRNPLIVSYSSTHHICWVCNLNIVVHLFVSRICDSINILNKHENLVSRYRFSLLLWYEVL